MVAREVIEAEMRAVAERAAITQRPRPPRDIRGRAAWFEAEELRREEEARWRRFRNERWMKR